MLSLVRSYLISNAEIKLSDVCYKLESFYEYHKTIVCDITLLNSIYSNQFSGSKITVFNQFKSLSGKHLLVQ